MYLLLLQYGWTALFYAAVKGHIEVIRLLLDREADVNSKDKVSDMIRETFMLVCEINCIIMTGDRYDSSIIVMSASQRQYKCDLSIIDLTSLYNCTYYLGV